MNSELRQDLVSGDWIVISPARAKRSSQLFKKIKKRKVVGKIECPFEDPKKSGQGKPTLVYGKTSDWINWLEIIDRDGKVQKKTGKEEASRALSR